MKKHHATRIAATLMLISTIGHAQPPSLIHYQGRLMNGTNLVNGPVNLMFRLHDHPTNKSIFLEATNVAVAVDGLYATMIGEYVTDGDLDAALALPEVWLEVFVNGFELEPRERLAAVPYARRVPGYDVRGMLTVVGNADYGMHTVHSNAVRGVVGGGFQNLIGAAQQSTVSGGRGNRILAGADSSAIGGGFSNTVSAAGGVVPGGDRNEAGLLAFAAGRRAKANHTGSFVWGDSTDADIASTANDQVTFRAGGGFRVVDGPISGDASGLSNFPSVLLINRARAGTGRLALQTNHVVNADWSTILGGANHEIGIGATHAVIGGGSNNVVEGQAGTVAGGANNRALAIGATISGGDGNRAQSPYSIVAGGQFNRATGSWSTVSGGLLNNALEWYSVVAGGNENTAAGFQSVVGGGAYNNAEVNGATIAGGVLNTASSLQVSIGGGLINNVHTNADYAVISGGRNNTVHPGTTAGAVGGGWANVIQADSAYSVIAGGSFNRINGHSATIGGGHGNWSAEAYGFIGGGLSNLNFSAGGTIGGGEFNATVNQTATIAGGRRNLAAGNFSFIGGGFSNLTSGAFAMIPGGQFNEASGNTSFAAGFRAKALHDGSWVWGDMTFSDVTSTADDQVTFRASGGYRLFSNSALTLGVTLDPNASAWAAVSDRNAKENFEAIDAAEILRGVAELPVTAWTYKDDPDHRRYIGPVAQDFHAAFGLGDDTTISTLDMDGVLISAVKALAEENARLREELDAIKRHLGL